MKREGRHPWWGGGVIIGDVFFLAQNNRVAEKDSP